MKDSSAPPVRLALAAAGAAGLAGATTSATLSELPAWAPALGPADQLGATLLAALAWFLLLPLLLPPRRTGDWLAGGLLSAACFLPALLAGERLSFAPPRALFLAGLWLVACWVAAGGLFVLLERASQRPAAHYLALLLALCLLPPILDFAGLELLQSSRLFAWLSPVERLVVRPQPQSTLPALLLLIGGSILLWRGRAWRPAVLLLGLCSTLHAAPRIERIEPLLGPIFRPELRYPLSIEVHGGAQGFRGAIELAWERDKLVRTVELGPGALRRFWLYPTAVQERQVAHVVLRRDGERIAALRWEQGRAERIYPVQRLAGVIGAGAGQLAYLREQASAHPRFELRFLPLERLPDQAAGLEALDLIVLCRDARELEPDQAAARALAAWVAAGGGLVLDDPALARLPWLRPLVAGAGPLPDRWSRRWLSAFAHGCGGGLVFRESLLREGLPGEGDERLWSLVDRRLLRARRRPTSPGRVTGTGRIFSPAGHPPQVRRRAHRLIWGLLGLLLLACGASAWFAPRPRATATTLCALLSLGGSLYLVRALPGGGLDGRSIGLLELGPGQSPGALRRWVRLSALVPARTSIRFDGEPPRLPGDAGSTLLSAGDGRWKLPLDLPPGGFRLLGLTGIQGGVGPLQVTRPSALAPHLLNSGRHTLRSVAVLDPDGARLHGDLEPGGAIDLSPSRGRRLDRESLARLLLPESPHPPGALAFLLDARRVESRRLVLARVDLPGPTLDGRGLLPPPPTPTLVLLPWR